MHKNYFEIKAPTTFELGRRKGELFGEFLRESLEEEKRDPLWPEKVRRSHGYLEPTAKLFPSLVDEYRGYAQGARVAFEDVWTLDIDEELEQQQQDKCTTVVSNSGYLVSHNEDWAVDSADVICILRRTVANLTVFELLYQNGLGGNSASFNSHGFAQTTNSVAHTDHQIGVPKKIFARLFADTDSPEATFKTLAATKRASGYHHTLVDGTGKIWSIECSARQQLMMTPNAPFVHTNHYVGEPLKELDANDNRRGTRTRYADATKRAPNITSVDAACSLLSDTSQGANRSVFNKRTIARMVVDLDHRAAHVWLRREQEAGWITYPLQF